MAADLDDGGGLGGEQFLAQAVGVERGGQDLQHFVAGRERAADARPRGGDGGDAGHDDGFEVGRQAARRYT